MKIAVTETHIANGNQASDFHCALALAFADAGFNASIGTDEVSFYGATNGDLLGSLLLRADARFWNARLDMGQKVEPFEFEMPGLRLPVHQSQFTDHVSTPVCHAEASCEGRVVTP